MQSAITRLDTDFTQGAPVATIQDDLATYYDLQTSVRGYAGLAASVATNTGFNGQVPNTEIETALGDSSYGEKELTVAYQLANEDWNLITNDGSLTASNTLYIPTISGDDYVHLYVFSENPDLANSGALNNWGGTPSALINDNWIGSTAMSYELSTVSSQATMIGSAADLYQSTANLTYAGFYTAGTTPNYMFSNINSILGD